MDQAITFTLYCYKLSTAFFDKLEERNAHTQRREHALTRLYSFINVGNLLRLILKQRCRNAALVLTLGQPYLALHNLPEVFGFPAKNMYTCTCKNMPASHTRRRGGIGKESKREVYVTQTRSKDKSGECTLQTQRQEHAFICGV